MNNTYIVNILTKIFETYHFNLDLTRIDQWVIVLIKNIFLIVISAFFIISLLKTNNLSNENLNKDNAPSNFNNNSNGNNFKNNYYQGNLNIGNSIYNKIRAYTLTSIIFIILSIIAVAILYILFESIVYNAYYDYSWTLYL